MYGILRGHGGGESPLKMLGDAVAAVAASSGAAAAELAALAIARVSGPALHPTDAAFAAWALELLPPGAPATPSALAAAMETCSRAVRAGPQAVNIAAAADLAAAIARCASAAVADSGSLSDALGASATGLFTVSDRVRAMLAVALVRVIVACAQALSSALQAGDRNGARDPVRPRCRPRHVQALVPAALAVHDLIDVLAGPAGSVATAAVATSPLVAPAVPADPGSVNTLSDARALADVTRSLAGGDAHSALADAFARALEASSIVTITREAVRAMMLRFLRGLVLPQTLSHCLCRCCTSLGRAPRAGHGAAPMASRACTWLVPSHCACLSSQVPLRSRRDTQCLRLARARPARHLLCVALISYLRFAKVNESARRCSYNSLLQRA